FLSTIRHPNIIQYLGMYQDSDTHLPVLLMELMDDSLTHFLESSPQPIMYHIQVNICHDVTLALSFLHSNGIVHRDLSGNNVLLISNVRAKVTDFGMASLKDFRATNCTRSFTTCPGTDVYMPPEAVQDKPVYTEKIDCFSFGVIAIQIMTRLFPQPGDRRKKIEIENVGLVEKRISEQERRQNHISKVDPNNPLLAIALDCLKDEDAKRPSAQDLCISVATLKEMQKYIECNREEFQQKCKTTTAVLLDNEELSKGHLALIEKLQTESDREMEKLRDQLEQVEKEYSIIQKQINKLQFLLSEKPTLHKLCHDGNMPKIMAYVTRINDPMLLGKMLGNRRGNAGYTPLHEAAANGKPEVLKYLLDLTGNANVNCRTRTNSYTPLHLAAINGHEKCLRELLVHGAEIDCVDVYGKTPKQRAKLGSIVEIALHSEGELKMCCLCILLYYGASINKNKYRLHHEVEVSESTGFTH
ncbi:MAG: protein kinase, partial [Proteobacteria bacterium]|nr:protein kinase [Pseudomonadota bacterium]